MAYRAVDYSVSLEGQFQVAVYVTKSNCRSAVSWPWRQESAVIGSQKTTDYRGRDFFFNTSGMDCVIVRGYTDLIYRGLYGNII